MSITLRITGIGLLFVLMIFSGIWLTKTGKPYNPVLFNLHKILSLVAVVLAGIQTYALFRQVDTGSLEATLLILAAGLFLILIISGGLLNEDFKIYDLLRTVHRITPLLAVAITVVIFYLALKKG